MTTNIYIPCIAYICAVILTLWRLLTFKKGLEPLGNCLLFLGRKQNFTYISIFLFSLCLIGFLFIRIYPLWITAVLAACGVMAVDISLKDILLRRKEGVYENGLIADGKLIYRKDIVAFPTLSYENDGVEASSVPPEMLQIVTAEQGVQLLRFKSEKERRKVVELIRHWTRS